MTNPIGKGTKQLSINVKEELHITLTQLAKESGMKIGEYCRAVLIAAAEEGTTAVRKGYAIRPGATVSLTPPQNAKVLGAVKLSKKVALGLNPKSAKPSESTSPLNPHGLRRKGP